MYSNCIEHLLNEILYKNFLSRSHKRSGRFFNPGNRGGGFSTGVPYETLLRSFDGGTKLSREIFVGYKTIYRTIFQILLILLLRKKE